MNLRPIALSSSLRRGLLEASMKVFFIFPLTSSGFASIFYGHFLKRDMPIIKSAKKRVRQTAVRQKRNYNTRTSMKKAIRAVEEAVKAGKKAEAEKLLPAAYKIIDTADKKNILQSNTAARRKSKLARMIADADADKKKAAPAKPVKAKKEVKA